MWGANTVASYLEVLPFSKELLELLQLDSDFSDFESVNAVLDGCGAATAGPKCTFRYKQQLLPVDWD